MLNYIEVLEDQKYYYCVMEKASGGDLLQHLVTKHGNGCVPESEMQHVVRQILESLVHTHKHGILHRDIKPSNLVVRQLSSSDGSGSREDCVTLIDFDHADVHYKPGGRDECEYVWGTKGYSAPEQYLGNSSPSSDLFSVGVSLYLLMTGKMPYDMHKMEAEVTKGHNWWLSIYKKMLHTDIDWECAPWPEREHCRDFCKWLLKFSPLDRPKSAWQALAHPWLKKVKEDSGVHLPPLVCSSRRHSSSSVKSAQDDEHSPTSTCASSEEAKCSTIKDSHANRYAD